MEEDAIRFFAQQLRKPQGDFAAEVASRMNTGNRLINLYALQELAVANHDRILEIGMGNGYFVGDLLNSAENVRYAGCDFSEEMVREAEEMNKHHVDNGSAEFRHGVIEKLPFDDSQFTKVYTVNTLYFWEDQERACAEVKRVLTPGGKFLIAIRPRKIMEAIPVCQYGFNLFDGDEVKAMLEQNGFQNTSIFEANEPDQKWEEGFLKMQTLVIQATSPEN